MIGYISFEEFLKIDRNLFMYIAAVRKTDSLIQVQETLSKTKDQEQRKALVEQKLKLLEYFDGQESD